MIFQIPADRPPSERVKSPAVGVKATMMLVKERTSTTVLWIALMELMHVIMLSGSSATAARVIWETVLLTFLPAMIQ